jgi:hypothetical protein
MSKARALMFRLLMVGIVLAALSSSGAGQGAGDKLEQGFKQPPARARCMGVKTAQQH